MKPWCFKWDRFKKKTSLQVPKMHGGFDLDSKGLQIVGMLLVSPRGIGLICTPRIATTMSMRISRSFLCTPRGAHKYLLVWFFDRGCSL